MSIVKGASCGIGKAIALALGSACQKVENNRLSEQKSRHNDQCGSLKTQLTVSTTREEQYQSQLKERGVRIEALEIKREVLIIKMMRHPNVVRLHEVLASREKIYIVLEFVSGGELFVEIVHRGKLSEKKSQKHVRKLGETIDPRSCDHSNQQPCTVGPQQRWPAKGVVCCLC